MKHYHLYTDGACSGNPGHGGFGVIAWDQDGNKIINFGRGYRRTTNNRMEILAVVEGLNTLLPYIPDSRDTDIKVTVYSDSQLVVNTMNQGWARKTNDDLWDRLDRNINSYRHFGISVAFVKVKGHSTDERNNLVDRLAVDCSSEKYAVEIDSVYEQISASPKVDAGLFDGEDSIEVPTVKRITLLGYETPEDRQVLVALSNGTVVTIRALYGGFQQTGCTQEESRITLDIAWRFQKWLNGGRL